MMGQNLKFTIDDKSNVNVVDLNCDCRSEMGYIFRNTKDEIES